MISEDTFWSRGNPGDTQYPSDWREGEQSGGDTYHSIERGGQGRPLFPKGQACCRGGPGAAEGNTGHRGRGYEKEEHAWPGSFSEALSEGPMGASGML